MRQRTATTGHLIYLCPVCAEVVGVSHYCRKFGRAQIILTSDDNGEVSVAKDAYHPNVKIGDDSPDRLVDVQLG